MSIRLVVIVSQYIQISNHHAVHLKLMLYSDYVNYFLIKLGKKRLSEVLAWDNSPLSSED